METPACAQRRRCRTHPHPGQAPMGAAAHSGAEVTQTGIKVPGTCPRSHPSSARALETQTRFLPWGWEGQNLASVSRF